MPGMKKSKEITIGPESHLKKRLIMQKMEMCR